MGRDPSAAAITPERVQEYLRGHGYPDARVSSLVPLGGDTQDGLKAYGYGRPLQTDFEAGGRHERLVIRTMSPDPFGHNRRADRAYQMVMSFDTFNDIERHIRALDVGAFDPEGRMISAPSGEFFLVSNYVEGQLYAKDLRAAQSAAAATPRDLERARALARYLVTLHARKVEPSVYLRHVRDTVGAGEGILGQIDGYPEDDPIATPERIHAIELQTVRWRWKLRKHLDRACRTHGDFHPFNILFREESDFSVLDCSRGGIGEPADDVTCLGINYLFFALNARPTFSGALREMWDVFWRTYLTDSRDTTLLELVPLYFSWRALVLCSPVWYPNLDPGLRGRLLRFCERLLDGARFDPERVEELLA